MFRCDEGKFYAFLVTEPVDIREVMQRHDPRPKKWTVWVSVGEGAEREEDWIRTHSGVVYLVGRKSTSRAMFQESRNGTTINFRRKYGEPIIVNIPADNTGRFEIFEERCGMLQATLFQPGNAKARG
jgi:hypothetical protein